MRLRIVETSYTTRFPWLFKLMDEEGNTFYIKSDEFYKHIGLKSPIGKRELDYYHKGLWITATVRDINGEGVVVNI